MSESRRSPLLPPCSASHLPRLARGRMGVRQLPHHLQRRLATQAMADQHLWGTAAQALLPERYHIVGSTGQRVRRRVRQPRRLAVVAQVQQQRAPGHPGGLCRLAAQVSHHAPQVPAAATWRGCVPSAARQRGGGGGQGGIASLLQQMCRVPEHQPEPAQRTCRCPAGRAGRRGCGRGRRWLQVSAGFGPARQSTARSHWRCWRGCRHAAAAQRAAEMTLRRPGAQLGGRRRRWTSRRAV